MPTETDAIDRQIEAQQMRVLNAKARKLELLDLLKEQDRVIAESESIITGLVYAKNQIKRTEKSANG